MLKLNYKKMFFFWICKIGIDEPHRKANDLKQKNIFVAIFENKLETSPNRV